MQYRPHFTVPTLSDLFKQVLRSLRLIRVLDSIQRKLFHFSRKRFCIWKWRLVAREEDLWRRAVGRAADEGSKAEEEKAQNRWNVALGGSSLCSSSCALLSLWRHRADDRKVLLREEMRKEGREGGDHPTLFLNKTFLKSSHQGNRPGSRSFLKIIVEFASWRSGNQSDWYPRGCSSIPCLAQRVSDPALP